jgi:hypothetical protein
MSQRRLQILAERESQPTRRKSSIASNNSASVSPKPSMRPDFVKIVSPRFSFTLPSTFKERL